MIPSHRAPDAMHIDCSAILSGFYDSSIDVTDWWAEVHDPEAVDGDCCTAFFDHGPDVLADSMLDPTAPAVWVPGAVYLIGVRVDQTDRQTVLPREAVVSQMGMDEVSRIEALHREAILSSPAPADHGGWPGPACGQRGNSPWAGYPAAQGAFYTGAIPRQLRPAVSRTVPGGETDEEVNMDWIDHERARLLAQAEARDADELILQYREDEADPVAAIADALEAVLHWLLWAAIIAALLIFAVPAVTRAAVTAAQADAMTNPEQIEALK